MICNIHVIYDTFVLHLLVMRDGCFIREIKNIIGVLRSCESECQEFVIANFFLFIRMQLIIPVAVSSGFLFYHVFSRLV